MKRSEIKRALKELEAACAKYSAESGKQNRLENTTRLQSTVVQLLPYHNLGVTKYLRISDKPVAEATPPSDAQMQKLKSVMEEYGLPVTIH